MSFFFLRDIGVSSPRHLMSAELLQNFAMAALFYCLGIFHMHVPIVQGISMFTSSTGLDTEPTSSETKERKEGYCSNQNAMVFVCNN